MLRNNRWAFWLLLVAVTALGLTMTGPVFSTTYGVGPGRTYQALGDVPWTHLMPGDIVQIYWRSQPYQEKLLLGCRGTADQPIQIIGIPGPLGQLPVIDGQNATTSPQFSFPWAGTQDRGEIIITLDKLHPYGYKPGYLVIQGLDVRNASPPNVFTDAQGLPRSYAVNAAAIFVERGEHIIVRGCTITGSANGFFVASGDDEATESRDILLDGCSVYGNGVVGSDREHNIYTEAIGAVFQNNHLGRLRSGALGSNLKDRSAGTVIRYNWIEGGAHMLDLVDAEDSWSITGQDPSYRQTFVYGNAFLNQTGDGICLVHYGGDSGDPTNYRKGVLYFYHNSIVTQCDQTDRWRTIILKLETDDESADVRNNIFCNLSATPRAVPSEFDLLGPAGMCNFGINWVAPAWRATPAGYNATAVITGTSNFLSGGSDPGFANLAAFDLHLMSSSSCIGAGGALPPAVEEQYDTTMEYQAPQSSTPRQLIGFGSDLGAFEAGNYTPPVTPPALYRIQGTVTMQGQSLAAVSISAGNVTTKTGSDGSYILSGLSAGTYLVSASASSYNFAGPQTVKVGPSNSNVNFAALPPAYYSIRGTITVRGKGVGWINVSAGNVTTKTSLDGSYVLSNLSAGTYTVSASATYYTFSGPQIVTVGSNVSGINFAAQVFVTGLTISPGTISSGGAAMGTLTLDSPAPVAMYVPLFVSNSSVSLQHAYVYVPPGMTRASFPIAASRVSTTTSVTVSAIYNGQWTYAAPLTITP